MQVTQEYIYSSNPWESNHRDGPTGHNNFQLEYWSGLVNRRLAMWVSPQVHCTTCTDAGICMTLASCRALIPLHVYVYLT